MVADDIRENIARVAGEIKEAALASARRPEEIKLMAVSKTRTLEEMLLASESVGLLGENRVQEAAAKRGGWPPANKTPWHLIGHLQRNKARKALEIFDAIESVDSFELARMLDRILAESGRTGYTVFLEVNMSGEPSKNGVEPVQARQLLENILISCPNISVKGLMTIGPLTDDILAVRRAFAGLRTLRDSMRAAFGLPLPELSMGMSGDFAVAIEEGSTIVRVGTAIFGSRPRL